MTEHTTPTNMPHTRRALAALCAQTSDPEVEPAVVDAAHILTALKAAAQQIGGADEHVRHWLYNTADGLAKPRRILSGPHVKQGRTALTHLIAYARTCPDHRRAVCEIMAAALNRAGATS